MNALPQADPAHALLKRVKHYVYNPTDILGAGNFSKVYSAKNELTSETVAIKVVELESLKTQRLQELLRTEIDVLTKLSHPNIIKCYEVFTFGNQCFIVTEVCDGGDLDMFVKKQGYLTEQRAASFIKDVFEGLSYLASMNVVHRDLKVANVFISNGVAKIADFGFAVFAKQKFRDLNIGSPLYMCPEGFIDCIYGPKTDIWAFGILIYELLHGDTPYSFCKLQNDLKYHLSIPFNRSKVKASISPDLREVIFRCLQIDEAKRVSTSELRETAYFKKLYHDTSFYVQPKYEEIRHPLYLSAEYQVPDRDGMSRHIGSIEREYPKATIQINIRPSSPSPTKVLNPVAPSPQNIRPKSNFYEGGRQKIIRLGRPISTDKHNDRLIPPIIFRQRVNSIDSKKPPQKHIFLNIAINFKIAVNILHYCRGLFRCIQLMIVIKQGETEIKFLTSWLIIVLEELNRKLNQGEIIFDGENSVTKAQKLREVRNEYERKYVNELKLYISSFINKPSLDDTKLFLFLRYRNYQLSINQQPTQSLLELGHLVVLLYDSTRLLKKCEQQGNFNRFLNYKDIQAILNWNKEKFDLSSYRTFKKRMIINN